MTAAASTRSFEYSYDGAGRLTQVLQDGQVTMGVSYDANGNRLSLSTPSGTVYGTYNERDEITSYAGTSYTFDADGYLQTATVDATGAQTQYDYDGFGSLREVTLPDGRQITYGYDAQHHRISKSVNGQLVYRLLYGAGSVPFAQASDENSPDTNYIYAEHAQVPSFMVRWVCTPEGDCHPNVYRLLKDHLGSVRLVVDTASGEVVQRIEYDVFGNVLSDTNPGFQPFGFAGGLYDADTGLVKFGARDYDAVSGRWTASDPIGFAGGNTNLYAYVANDPINLIDPSGLVVRMGTPFPWPGDDAMAFYAGVINDPCSGSFAKAGAWVGGTLAALASSQLGPITTTLLTTVGGIVIVTPAGEAIPIPEGATGPLPTRAPGMQFVDGEGGYGMDPRVTGARVMEGNSDQGPRVVYMNEQGQTVNPATGNTVSNADPAAHQYLQPW